MSLITRIFTLDQALLSRLEANDDFLRQTHAAQETLETELRDKGYEVLPDMSSIWHGLSESIIVLGKSDMPSDIDFYIAAGRGMLPYRHRSTGVSDHQDSDTERRSPSSLPVFREFRIREDDILPLLEDARFLDNIGAVQNRLRGELHDKQYLLFSESRELCYNGGSLPAAVIVCGKRDRPSDLDFLAAASEPVRLRYPPSTVYEAAGSNALRSVTADMFLHYTLHVDRLAAQVTKAQFLQYATDPRSKCEELRQRVSQDGGILLESAEHFLGAPRHLLVGVFSFNEAEIMHRAIEVSRSFESKLAETRLPYDRTDPYFPLWR